MTELTEVMSLRGNQIFIDLHHNIRASQYSSNNRI